MSMTSKQIAIVQTTFSQITDADLLTTRFYTRLFEIDPSTRPLFTHDMAEQRLKLILAISMVVHSLNNLSDIIPLIQGLGKRHVIYGVKAEHWNSVGSALLWALEDALGSAFTSEVREAWVAAYTLIVQTAIDAHSGLSQHHDRSASV